LSNTIRERTAPPTVRTLTPQQRRAFHRWILGLYLRRWLAAQPIIPPDLAPIADCIKQHESGNYSEQSHPGAGSGAYQYIPTTWQHWFAAWASATGWSGPQYSLAYLAPPNVQDRVLVYTLRNGGAGNWSNAFGFDPCTQGMT
jgi:hypothetical protein